MRAAKLLAPMALLLSVAVLMASACGGDGDGHGAGGLIPADGGGTVTSDDGKLTLEIPPGALSEDTEITATAVPLEELPQELRELPGATDGYRFEPEGLEFSEPVAVSLRLDRTELEDVPENGVPAYTLVGLNLDSAVKRAEPEEEPDNRAIAYALAVLPPDGAPGPLGAETAVQPVQPTPLDDTSTEGTLGENFIRARGLWNQLNPLTTTLGSLTVALDEVPMNQPVRGTFTIKAKVSNTGKGPVVKLVEGSFFGQGNVSAPGSAPFGIKYELFPGDEIAESQIFLCGASPGAGDYSVVVTTSTGPSPLQGYPAQGILINGLIECVEPTPTPTPVTDAVALDAFAARFPGFAELPGMVDPVEDLIYSITGVPPFFVGPEVDMALVFAGIFDMTQQANKSTFGNTVFPCDTVIEGRRTVCPAAASPVPPGEVIVLAMVLDGDVPMDDPDHVYTYSAVFDADGDPANNFQFVEPFNWDFFQGTDRWYELEWDPQLGQWQLFVSAVGDQFPQEVVSAARVVIDRDLIVFFIPVDEFGVPRPGYRLTAFGTDANRSFAPEVSGGDVTGADPTEPLLALPEDAIVIEDVEDVLVPHEDEAPGGDELVPVEPPVTIIE